MKRRKNKIGKIIISVLLIVLVFLLFYYFIDDKSKNNFIFSNIKDLTASVSNISSFSFVRKDNKYNKEFIKSINDDYKKEIKKLKETLNLNSLNSDKIFINSTVIKRSTNYWYNVITIDKGKNGKIKEGYAVINNDGLVGKIIKVNNTSSDVKLLTSLSENEYVSASFNYDGIDYYGLLSDYDYKKNEFLLKNVVGQFDKEKIKNINITTSGLTDSFSSGLLIGKIKDIKKDTFGISNTIIITPSVNFNSINIVSVVVGDK